MRCDNYHRINFESTLIVTHGVDEQQDFCSVCPNRMKKITAGLCEPYEVVTKPITSIHLAKATVLCEHYANSHSVRGRPTIVHG